CPSPIYSSSTHPRPTTQIPLLFSVRYSTANRSLPSFPTRRSSDLHTRHQALRGDDERPRVPRGERTAARRLRRAAVRSPRGTRGDRKSTRLNFSHRTISYAVFCLKKKKIQNTPVTARRTRPHGSRA